MNSRIAALVSLGAGPCVRAVLASLLVGGLAGGAVWAEDSSWAGYGGGEWENGVNWFPAVVPGDIAGDNNPDEIVFTRSRLTENGEVTLSGERKIRGITFDNDVASAYYYKLATGTLQLSAGGGIRNQGVFGGQNMVALKLRLLGDATFENSATGRGSTILVSSPITTAERLGQVRLFLTGSFGGGLLVSLASGDIREGVGTKLSVIKMGKGAWQLNGDSNFTGGVYIKSGALHLSGSSNSLGKGVVMLGDSESGADVLLGVGSYVGYGNPLLVEGGAGTRRLMHLGNGPGTYSGPLTLRKGLEIGNVTAGTFTLGASRSGIGGEGNLGVEVNGAGSIIFKGVIDVAGLINHTGTGEGEVVFDGMLGAEVRGLIQRSATSPIVLNAPNVHGRTDVLEGTVVVGKKGTLGLGDVMVAGRGALVLGGAQALAEGATLVVAPGAKVSLEAGNQVVRQLGLATGIFCAAGVFTADQLNGFVGSKIFSGAGIWQVRERGR